MHLYLKYAWLLEMCLDLLRNIIASSTLHIVALNETVQCELHRLSDTGMDLQSAIAEAIVAMDLFFNNHFAESKVIFQKW